VILRIVAVGLAVGDRRAKDEAQRPGGQAVAMLVMVVVPPMTVVTVIIVVAMMSDISLGRGGGRREGAATQCDASSAERRQDLGHLQSFHAGKRTSPGDFDNDESCLRRSNHATAKVRHRS
jgi:hypothetical protein